MTILITGGTGFLGRRLALRWRNTSDVVLAARNNKQNQMAAAFTGCDVLPMDVSRLESVKDVVNRVRPSLIIHAAATKFVDLAEREPLECVDVNVSGSTNIARAAIDAGVSSVVGISTDKASPPIRNTYGLSKALMERAFSALDRRGDTRFMCVRYGNVAWSTGSVLPIWKRMHESTGEIGTTGPQMRRYFFTVEEAVELVDAAVRNLDSLHGTVLCREMKAARIQDILDIWIKRKGGSWRQIEARPGERVDELLIGEPELEHAWPVPAGAVPHYAIRFNEPSPEPLPAVLSSATATRLTEDDILTLIDHPPPEELG